MSIEYKYEYEKRVLMFYGSIVVYLNIYIHVTRYDNNFKYSAVL